MLKVKKSGIAGQGLYTTAPLPARKKIGELTGERVRQREARRRARGRKVIAIVELNNGWAIDATESESPFRYINHSCEPNCYIRIFGWHIEFYALRALAAGEELTCDYGESHHEGTQACGCGAVKCRGFL